MKLHLNLSHGLHLGHSIPKTMVYSNHELEILKTTNKTSIKKLKTNLNKLSPLHWYDGIWDDLNFKM